IKTEAAYFLDSLNIDYKEFSN
ncbi:MAG: hypothetical protein ACD_77C00185G0001, partial [uncultured bacterium]